MFENVESKWIITNFVKEEEEERLKLQFPFFFNQTTNQVKIIGVLYIKQGCQFQSVSSGMAETFHTNSKNRTKWNNFHLISNLGPFRIFRLNSGQNVSVSFRMFCSSLEKLNYFKLNIYLILTI
jgi:hypothetical protein